jgi:plastocyanin
MKNKLLVAIFAFAALALNAATFKVTVKNYSFSPSALTINKGDTVVWNFTGGTHTTTSGSSCTSDGKWDSGDKNSGESYSHVFSTSGTFPYFCTPHCASGMTGSVTVSASAGVEENNVAAIQLTNFPNPFNDNTNITVSLNEPAMLDIHVFDVNGREVFKNNNLKASIGANNYTVSLNDAPSGIYMMQLYANGKPAQSKMILKN